MTTITFKALPRDNTLTLTLEIPKELRRFKKFRVYNAGNGKLLITPKDTNYITRTLNSKSNTISITYEFLMLNKGLEESKEVPYILTEFGMEVDFNVFKDKDWISTAERI